MLARYSEMEHVGNINDRTSTRAFLFVMGVTPFLGVARSKTMCPAPLMNPGIVLLHELHVRPSWGWGGLFIPCMNKHKHKKRYYLRY